MDNAKPLRSARRLCWSLEVQLVAPARRHLHGRRHPFLVLQLLHWRPPCARRSSSRTSRPWLTARFHRVVTSTRLQSINQRFRSKVSRRQSERTPPYLRPLIKFLGWGLDPVPVAPNGRRLSPSMTFSISISDAMPLSYATLTFWGISSFMEPFENHL